MSPHHNASLNSLIGGGSPIIPGEISLAHNGILFLDEIAEFNKKTLDALRQPMEDKQVTISWVKNVCTFPSNFMRVAAMNPCPCGYYGQEKCRCSEYFPQRNTWIATWSYKLLIVEAGEKKRGINQCSTGRKT